jgi:tetratricopeptide (TPR) repeat protein
MLLVAQSLLKLENVLFDKGLVLYKMGNITGALTYLDKVSLAIDPKDKDALYQKLAIFNMSFKCLFRIKGY